jgi:hypothetical protein
MQGSWVSSPNISGSGNTTPLPGYDRMGNEIGVPLRYYDRMGNNIPASVYSKTNNLIKIEPDPPSYFESLSMQKRKDDFDNAFKMPKQFVPEIKINTEPIFKIRSEPVFKFKPEPTIEFKMPEPVIPKFKPIEIKPMETFDFFKTEKKSKKYSPFDPSTW